MRSSKIDSGRDVEGNNERQFLDGIKVKEERLQKGRELGRRQRAETYEKGGGRNILDNNQSVSCSTCSKTGVRLKHDELAHVQRSRVARGWRRRPAMLTNRKSTVAKTGFLGEQHLE